LALRAPLGKKRESFYQVDGHLPSPKTRHFVPSGYPGPEVEAVQIFLPIAFLLTLTVDEEVIYNFSPIAV
jgi:hypothetical protein